VSLPTYVYADRRIPDEERVREALDAETLTKFGDDERLERLHRVFYPAFRVEYEYETRKGKLFRTETEAGRRPLLDGLWDDNDRALSRSTPTGQTTPSVEPRTTTTLAPTSRVWAGPSSSSSR